eukprot:TRINITY_DN41219_c0_g1_i1.p1 TRINITY_DN41219_c0_g1~~TRINITY_DN41219_c0_g1_i1.p1  ORF type:complete len:451 (-),score=59.26 TRINITY_DN41219_c0_g1_i1:137-1489(-)
MGSDNDKHSSYAAGNSLAISVMTVCRSMLGVGMFSLPLGLVMGTMAPSFLVLVYLGCVHAISFFMVGYGAATWNVSSFRECWLEAVRVLPALSRLSGLLDSVMLFDGTLSIVTYCILVGDFAEKSLEGVLGAGHPLALGRFSAVVLISLVVILPLCLVPTLRALRYTNALSLCALCYALALMLVDAIRNVPDDLGVEDDSADEGVVMWGARWSILSTIALFNQAYIAHYNAPCIYQELEDKSPRRWSVVVGTAYLLCALANGIIAFAGVRRFGARVEGDLLRMYPATPAVVLAWCALTVSTSMSYPLVFRPWRESAVATLYQAGGIQAEKLTPAKKRAVEILVTCCVVPMSAILGGLVDDLGLTNALSGSISGPFVAFILPAGIFYAAVESQKEQLACAGPAAYEKGQAQIFYRQVVATAVGALGITLLLLGPPVVLYSAMRGSAAEPVV